MRFLCLFAALTLAPTAAFGDHNLDARNHFNAWRWKQAAESCRAAIAGGTADATTHLTLVRALIAGKGKSAEAVAAADAAMAAFPDEAPALAAKGASLFRQADFVEAEKSTRAALAKDPALASAWLTLARIHSIVSLNAKAASMMERAFTKDPNDVEILYGRAGILNDDQAHLDALSALLSRVDPAGDPQEVEQLRAHVASDTALLGKKLRLLKSAYTAGEIKLSSAGERWTIKASVNGQKPVKLLLDTGASGILIGASAAKRSGLTPLSDQAAPALGIGSEKPAQHRVALADRIAIGGVEFENFPVRAFSRKQVADEDGLIGVDVFSDFLVTLDLKRGILQLAPLPELTAPPDRETPHDRVVNETNKDFQRVMRVGNHLIIPALVNGKVWGKFLIDTGASMNVLHTGFARQSSRVANAHGVIVTGVQGRVKETHVADRAKLQFAGFQQDNESMLSIDFSPNNDEFGVELAGILGMPVLGHLKLTIDYWNGLIRFERSR